jgi:diguanylate cyclase (GGDEF)-like protein/PAS domain S-box-containing protein
MSIRRTAEWLYHRTKAWLCSHLGGICDAITSTVGTHHPSRLLLLLRLSLIVIIWGLAAAQSIAERNSAIEGVRTHLWALADTLATVNDLEQKTETNLFGTGTADDTVIWQALLRFPTASIWVERRGTLFAGELPAPNLRNTIMVAVKRGEFTVHAALPLADALRDWRWTAWLEGAALSLFTLVFMLLGESQRHALRRRQEAEREAAVAGERARQLARYQTELEATVNQRTAALEEAYVRLDAELEERRAAEEALRKHDGLLKAVTKSAAELLGSHRFEEALPRVLELIGKTLGVRRALLRAIERGEEGHLTAKLVEEWCPPEIKPLREFPALRVLDLDRQLPTLVAPALERRFAWANIDEIPEPYRRPFAEAGLFSGLQVPVVSDGKLWGSCNFMGSSPKKREWNWAETDTLSTLSELIGAAISRERTIKELADANTIVQNSPTILYRLAGEPSFRLIYISDNIAKFGHDPEKLLAAADWTRVLVRRDDEPKLRRALTGILRREAEGSSIEFRLLTGDGGERWVENRYHPVRDEQGRLCEVEGIVIDITERKAAEEKITLLARTDSLTGLANRATFFERLNQAFAASKRGGAPFAVLFIDIDDFKNVNDTLGHQIGDLLLSEVASRLKNAIRETDLVARYGGDEFGVLQTDTSEPANAGALASKILGTLSRRHLVEGNEIHVTASIGISPFTAASGSADQILSQADLALYRAKEEGGNQYRFHSQALDQEVLLRMTLAEDLRKAIEGEELELYYQPQVELVSGKIVGMEALVRWHHPTRGLLYPPEFIPIAEKTGAILALGRWVLDHACRQLRLWREEGIAPPLMAINLSLVQLKTGQAFLRDVAETAAKWNLEPSDLEFDVTEATLAQVTWTQNDVLAELRGLGAKIALDDFGTAYSSFDYVRAYGVNHLKIDQSFIREATRNPDRATTIRAILAVAREFGIGVIAEGVETAEERALLVDTGMAAHAQGHYFSAAVDASRARELLRQGSVKPLSEEEIPRPDAG